MEEEIFPEHIIDAMEYILNSPEIHGFGFKFLKIDELETEKTKQKEELNGTPFNK